MNRLAQNTYQLLEPSALPGGATTVTNFGTYFEGVVLMIFIMSAVLAVLMIVIGGVQYIMSDIAGTQQAAKARIFSAIVGLFLLIISALILLTINPDLLSIDAFVPTAAP